MGKGKSKIEIKKVESLQARNVYFSKRRKGLFKKAEELGVLFPQVRIAAVVFSPAGKPYVFGDPHSVLSGNYSEIQKLLAVDIETMGVEDLKAYASLLEKSRNSLLLNVNGAVTQEKEKGKEEISAESSNREIPILEFESDTTFAASSSLCQEIPNDDFDFSLEDLDFDLDGFDAEAFVNQVFVDGAVTEEEEKEKGEEERREEIAITAAAESSSNWFYPEMPILEFDTTFAASSSLCQEIPDGHFDYSPEDLDLDGLNAEAFVNQFLA